MEPRSASPGDGEESEGGAARLGLVFALSVLYGQAPELLRADALGCALSWSYLDKPVPP